MSDVTYTLDEKEGSITAKEGETETKYVKESDLLAVKGSRDDLQKKLEAALNVGNKTDPEADAKLASANDAKVKAEAEVERLTEEIKKHTGNEEETKKLQTQLEAAQKSGEETGNQLLELKRQSIINTYHVPPETVNEKDLAGLATFEEALKAVIGSGGAGNYAIGAGSGGADSLKGKSPQELAVMAYEQTSPNK